MAMVELNLPEYEYKVKKREDGSWDIWDRLRERWVSLTPEEWVRQHFVNWLIADKQFPAALMGNEVSLTQNGIARRILHRAQALPAGTVDIVLNKGCIAFKYIHTVNSTKPASASSETASDFA